MTIDGHTKVLLSQSKMIVCVIPTNLSQMLLAMVLYLQILTHCETCS